MITYTKIEKQEWANAMLKMDLEHSKYATYTPPFEKRIIHRRIRHQKTKEFLELYFDLPR